MKQKQIDWKKPLCDCPCGGPYCNSFVHLCSKPKEHRSQNDETRFQIERQARLAQLEEDLELINESYNIFQRAFLSVKGKYDNAWEDKELPEAIQEFQDEMEEFKQETKAKLEANREKLNEKKT